MSGLFNKTLLTVISVLTCLQMQAQYNQANSFIRKALVAYHIDSKGFYVRETEKMLDEVSSVESNYAYDKKAQNLYVVTATSNIVVTLNKDYAKIVKKNKSIPQLKDEALDKEVARQTQLLDEKFAKLNAQREQHLRDSIQKAREDSIAEVRKQEAIIAERNKKSDDYRKSHIYHFVPTVGIPLHCEICDETIARDSVFSYGIANDTIYFVSNTEGKLGLSYMEPHKAKIVKYLSDNKSFKYHYEVFKDSLTKDSVDYDFLTTYWGYTSYTNYLKELKQKAPYGYFDEWGWDAEYSMVSFHFRYVNTNPKTIKYITVYFKITNDVGDLRKTGYFRGTGPLEEDESASWSWDSSSYFVAGDASNMNITKVVLTYMNGKTQVVTGKYLQFD